MCGIICQRAACGGGGKTLSHLDNARRVLRCRARDDALRECAIHIRSLRTEGLGIQIHVRIPVVTVHRGNRNDCQFGGQFRCRALVPRVRCIVYAQTIITAIALQRGVARDGREISGLFQIVDTVFKTIDGGIEFRLRDFGCDGRGGLVRVVRNRDASAREHCTQLQPVVDLLVLHFVIVAAFIDLRVDASLQCAVGCGTVGDLLRDSRVHIIERGRERIPDRDGCLVRVCRAGSHVHVDVGIIGCFHVHGFHTRVHLSRKQIIGGLPVRGFGVDVRLERGIRLPAGRGFGVDAFTQRRVGVPAGLNLRVETVGQGRVSLRACAGFLADSGAQREVGIVAGLRLVVEIVLERGIRLLAFDAFSVHAGLRCDDVRVHRVCAGLRVRIVRAGQTMPCHTVQHGVVDECAVSAGGQFDEPARLRGHSVDTLAQRGVRRLSCGLFVGDELVQACDLFGQIGFQLVDALGETGLGFREPVIEIPVRRVRVRGHISQIRLDTSDFYADLTDTLFRGIHVPIELRDYRSVPCPRGKRGDGRHGLRRVHGREHRLRRVRRGVGHGAFHRIDGVGVCHNPIPPFM